MPSSKRWRQTDVKNKRTRLLDFPATDVRGISTERVNPASRGLDSKSALEIARIINEQDELVPRAVAKALPEIARVIDLVTDALSRGGRLIYVGTGTSGRLGALDASECPPTYNADPKMVQYVIAGGDRALTRAVEASEDSTEDGAADIAKKKPGRKDIVVGLAASGRTPYTMSALAYARKKGSQTVAVTAVPGSPITRAAEFAIAIDVGPEVIAGSTRMKAGTMQKLVLNMITTGAFTRLGYVYDNLMVNVHLNNRKLAERSIGIVQQITELDRDSAIELLKASGGSVQVALVMIGAGVPRGKAEKLLKKNGGSVRRALKGR